MVVALDPLVGLVFGALIPKAQLPFKRIGFPCNLVYFMFKVFKNSIRDGSPRLPQAAGRVCGAFRSKESCFYPYDNLESVIIPTF